MLDNHVHHLIKRDESFKPQIVIYIMETSLRMSHNPGLKQAEAFSTLYQIPLQICVFINPNTPFKTNRKDLFLYEGILDIYKQCQAMHLSFQCGSDLLHDFIYPSLSKQPIILFDQGYLSFQREHQKKVYFELVNRHDIDFYLVEGNVFVPVKKASDKGEYGAYTIRKKIMNQVFPFHHHFEVKPFMTQENTLDWEPTLQEKINSYLSPSIPRYFIGGEMEGKKRLHDFIQSRLPLYDHASNPAYDVSSKLSMYLRYGFISPFELVEEVNQAPVLDSIKEKFIEQLIVRRELSVNFVYYQTDYLNLDSFSEAWMKNTMSKHLSDPRPIHYQIDDYLHLRTHDIYFNAAMKEMMTTGFMHGYMRMYWAKKIIEWSPSYQEAFETLVRLNDTYFLDGVDPNSYASIAWCFGKHDRPWQERPIFGVIRYMNEAGLKRKFDMSKYIERINLL